MIRRIASVLLFVLGGWILATELFAASLDVEPGVWDSLAIVGIFVPIAGVPLLAGALTSRGDRWRELGLTILVSVGVAVATFACVTAVMLDPAFARQMPPLHEIRLDPLIGLINLLVVGAVGSWLYRRRARHPNETERD